MSIESALKAVMTLVACYPNSNPSDQFVKMASKALEDYPESTLIAMCDPKTGIVTKSPYMPSISGMVDWVRNYAPTQHSKTYFVGTTPPPASPESKAKVDEIVASLPFMQPKQPLKLTEEDLEALKEKYVTLAPPRLPEAVQRALIEKEEFRALYGKKMPN